ncbi:hypothetical protein D6764_01190 [Candidatus Woesearchaeota archaeon]|nr:MAG: hypothetical protein D6764_01190 [Candidatus Woesearchaeota archaeon]
MMMKNDFELRIRQFDKSIFGNHEARELLKNADEVLFLYGTAPGPGFSDSNYVLAEIKAPSGAANYFLNADGSYRAAREPPAGITKATADNYQHVRRNKPLEKVLSEAPRLLENAEAKQYLESLVGDPREDMHYIADAEVVSGLFFNEPFSVVSLKPRQEESIYYLSVGGDEYRRDDKLGAILAKYGKDRIPPIPRAPWIPVILGM